MLLKVLSAFLNTTSAERQNQAV